MKQQPRLVVVTDVDGCLVDHATYSHAAADSALARLRQHHVPVVLCSSKTRPELERLQQELGLSDPFISENGSALFAPRGVFPFSLPGARDAGGYQVIEFGRPYQQVVDLLVRTARRVGVGISCFSDMSVEQVAEDCGLSLAQARLAKLREYDEPFRLIDPDPDARTTLHRGLRAAGLRCSSGGRYDHVTGATDKGVAVEMLRRCYAWAWGDVVMVGLGDSLNDLALLRAVDVPIVVRNSAVGVTESMVEQVRGARATTAEGAAGWGEAIMALIDERATHAGAVPPGS